ncbi:MULTISPECIES: hypothetical protein [unclassified Colwellia]|jgi:hypothetical protein|uniref:hypothetical protein n=1 Tax=unclassified Colwellia TaxID=196834 RepID=UPI0015F4C65D|nr:MULTISPECIES: hypothetical protein [unclassified Colwellia]MBA6379297.1 hypothetical protein [Colwellia sp. BRX10-7]MBA6387093.1 hypothetical protein [Colwellia sp. BRX10-2]MBA6401829.1 hypothetical protein [Colwellia sp. BRX10-5]MBA6405739.1 hypothetical protein [Colwellia sp. BRX10-1]
MFENLSESEIIKVEEKLGRVLINSIAREGIAEGLLDLDGLGANDAKRKALDYARDYVNNDGGITHSVLEHKDTLLEEARGYFKAERIELSIVLYGTWWEHWLNGIVKQRVTKQGLNENDFKEIVRSLNNKAKTSWLFKLLNLSPLAPEHLKVMALLTEKRNQFIHYKYPANKWEDREILPNQFFETLEKSISYFEHYEETNIYSSFSIE